MADREVARVLPPARTHQRVFCIVMVDGVWWGAWWGTMTVNLVSNPVAHHSLSLRLCLWALCLRAVP